ncbi:nuclear transcription factor Y subunit C-3-like [Salvia miltiorrhiza]|uniref:nuclear transcription factor Y subunit C-3-like n=1 Tax=Salvia miltiorrhiza TaxID=226208 RepID=UPI0025ABBA3E|nr:nuclear transcription factor Y subunit C-3-like [Salvia miltiorrhiza]
MDNNREKKVMNLSHSSSASQQPFQMHNFMPMPSSSLHVDHHQCEAERGASFVNQLKEIMQSFWRDRLSEICDAPTDVRSPHTLPLARIKKVMKSDEKVKMISGDTPALFGKACEIFVMELSVRAWMHTQLNNRKTVQRNDVAYAIRDDATLLAFLDDVVPLESHHEPQVSISHHHGVYVPHPFTNQSLLEGGGRPDHDHHLPFPINLHHNYNPDAHVHMGRSGGEQHINHNFPPSYDGTNPYLTFKEFFQ